MKKSTGRVCIVFGFRGCMSFRLAKGKNQRREYGQQNKSNLNLDYSGHFSNSGKKQNTPLSGIRKSRDIGVTSVNRCAKTRRSFHLKGR